MQTEKQRKDSEFNLFVGCMLLLVIVTSCAVTAGVYALLMIFG